MIEHAAERQCSIFFVDWDNGGAFPKDFFLVLDAYAINLGGIGEQLKL